MRRPGLGSLGLMLWISQGGFEDRLASELAEAGWPEAERGPGWARTSAAPLVSGEDPFPSLAFPHRMLGSPFEVRGESVNALAQQLLGPFLESLQGERVEAPWPCVFSAPPEMVGIGRRVSAVEEAFREGLRKRLSRVSRLAAGLPRGVGAARGYFVHFVDFGRAFASREAFLNGQHRMADDPLAPSRSYLKVEEAYSILGREPAPGDTVADLGAAPGGWSYSAAKRGASVLAVDNGPLKAGALGNPNITALHADAFGYVPAPGSVHDWLFCDLVEEPHHVLRNIVHPWLANGWCRSFIVNVKLGRADPGELLRELRSPDSPFRPFDPMIRHLYHDRDELTLMGSLLPKTSP